ncbi:MAG: hypothetical protein JXB39_15205 [Deltaproteobacteria bacterium]|nr:hypothetical protein [Deltaproteobacteria bacterium]
MDLDRALEAVSPRVRRAVWAAHEALNAAGVPHLLVGGLAVGAYGYPYATQDVDFLVGDDAFEFHGAIVLHAPGVPIQVGGVVIDYVSPDAHVDQQRLIEEARGDRNLHVVPIEHLVYMKLVAGRQRDMAAIVGLLQAGMDAEGVRAFLAKAAPDLVGRYDRLVIRAAREERR